MREQVTEMAVGGEKSLNLSVERIQQVQFRQNTPRASFSALRTSEDLDFSTHLRSNEGPAKWQ